MVLRLYNTLTRRVEKFEPLDDRRVKMFVCGVTEYDYVHLGHARTYAFYDTLLRFLRHEGYKVYYIQNITDVGHLLDSGEDRAIKKAEQEKKDPMQIVDFFLNHHLEQFDRLRILRPDQMHKATDHIKEIIEQVGRLILRKYAYVANGSVYFDVAKFSGYGKLSRNVPESLRTAVRI